MGISGLRISYVTIDEAGLGWIEPVDLEEDPDDRDPSYVLGYN